MTEKGRRMLIRAYLFAQINEFQNLKNSVFNLLKQDHNQLIERLLIPIAKKVDRYYIFFLDRTITKKDFQLGLKQEIRIAWRELCEEEKIMALLRKEPELERKITSQRTELIYRYFEPVFLNFDDILELVDIFHSAEKIAQNESSHAVPILLHKYSKVLRIVYQNPENLRWKMEKLLSPLADPELLEKLLCPMNLQNNPNKEPAGIDEIKNAIKSAVDLRLKEIFNSRP